VRRVVISHPDGEKLEILKNERTDANFVVTNMPEGRELKYPAVTDQIGSALGYMTFEDVRPASEVAFDGPVVVTEYETWDGLRVTVKLVKQDEKAYAKFECAYDAALRVEPATVPPPPPGEGEAEGETPPPAEEPLAPEEQVRTEAEKLATRLPEWAYELPGYRATNLEMRLDGLLKPLPDVDEPPPAPPESTPPPPGDGHEHGDQRVGGGDRTEGGR
jgi:hypothetical protein